MWGNRMNKHDSPNKTWLRVEENKKSKNLTVNYVSGKRGCRGRREHNVNAALVKYQLFPPSFTKVIAKWFS